MPQQEGSKYACMPADSTVITELYKLIIQNQTLPVSLYWSHFYQFRSQNSISEKSKAC